MYATVKKVIELADIEHIPNDRWYQYGSIVDTPVKPFGVFRLSGHFPGVTSRSPVREVRLELWVHDEPGSYLRITDTLKALDSTFKAVIHASAAEGESISQTKWDSWSPDLNDDGFKTICKMTSFTLIGKG